LRALPPAEAQTIEHHIALCEACRLHLTALRPLVDSFTAWPVAVVRPPTSLWDHLLARIAPENNDRNAKAHPTKWIEPEWEEVASGISCKLLSNDRQADRVSMLVRLAPGVEYPPHRHSGTEELFLLQGELWIGDK